MNRPRLELRITDDEGYRQHPYKDHLGIWTAGVGHKIHDSLVSQFLRERTLGNLLDWLSDPVRHAKWFETDVNVAIQIARDFAGSRFDELTDIRQEVLVEMAFQMGLGLHKFRDLKAALATDTVDDDIAEMIDSLWARVQTPGRAHKLAELYRAG